MNQIFGSFIYSFSRADAINSGVLVDLSAVCPEECRLYRYPVACTAAVWLLVEQATNNRKYYNSIAGVVWDIVYMSQNGIVDRPDEQTVIFRVIITGTGRRSTHSLKAVCGPGDDMAPVVTIMLLGED